MDCSFTEYTTLYACLRGRRGFPRLWPVVAEDATSLGWPGIPLSFGFLLLLDGLDRPETGVDRPSKNAGLHPTTQLYRKDHWVVEWNCVGRSWFDWC